MKLQDQRVAFVMAASHCNLDEAMEVMDDVVAAGAEVQPVISRSIATVETRFGSPQKWKTKIRDIAGRDAWDSIPQVEPIGPRDMFDVVLVCPCTGNTVAKLSSAMTDSQVVMAVKAQLRNQKPVVIAMTSNDLLGLNAVNWARLINTKNVYFVPFGQDNPWDKPNSMSTHWDLAVAALAAALQGHQLQPVMIPHWVGQEHWPERIE